MEMTGWLFTVAAAMLALAGVLRLPARTPAVRATTTGLFGAAVASLAEVGSVADGLASLLRAPQAADLLGLLALTAAATAGFALFRWVSLAAQLQNVRPAAVGLGVALLQVLIFIAAAHPAPPGTTSGQPGYFSAAAQHSEVALLWAVTVSWPVMVAALLASLAVTYQPAVAERSVRAALVVAGMGLAVLLAATGAHVLAVATHHMQVAATLVDVFYGSGLVLLGIGLLAPRVAPLLAPYTRRRTLRRLRRLAGVLASSGSPWAARWHARDSSTQWVTDQRRIYLTVMCLREVSWDLLQWVDNCEVNAAIDFARREIMPDDDKLTPTEQRRIAALAEACWLNLALLFASDNGGLVEPGGPAVLDTSLDESAVIDADIDFLLEVERACRRRRSAIARFLTQSGPPIDDAGPPRPRPWRRHWERLLVTGRERRVQQPARSATGEPGDGPRVLGRPHPTL